MDGAGMTEITATILADSVSPIGDRLTTIKVRFPRPFLPELNTHRNQSKNGASSRAIPIRARLHEATNDPAWPLELRCEQPGMSGGELLEGQAALDATDFLARIHADLIEQFDLYVDAHPDPATRLHKSILARYLEPWLSQTMILSATDWRGFFAQRIYGGAAPEMRALAMAVRDALEQSEPKALSYGQWHLPLVEDHERDEYDEIDQLRMAVARIARVSTGREDRRDVVKDRERFEDLANSGHCSPFEHVARPTDEVPVRGNFTGWAQLRHILNLDAVMLRLDPANRPEPAEEVPA